MTHFVLQGKRAFRSARGVNMRPQTEARTDSTGLSRCLHTQRRPRGPDDINQPAKATVYWLHRYM